MQEKEELLLGKKKQLRRLVNYKCLLTEPTPSQRVAQRFSPREAAIEAESSGVPHLPHAAPFCFKGALLVLLLLHPFGQQAPGGLRQCFGVDTAIQKAGTNDRSCAGFLIENHVVAFIGASTRSRFGVSFV